MKRIASFFAAVLLALPAFGQVGGGVYAPSPSDRTLLMGDNTTNDVSTSKHGFAPKAPNDATRYLDGTGAYSVPAGTGVTASSVAAFTNKTYDTAGTGNSFLINGVAVTTNTGTGAVARAAGPTFTTPTLGVATGTSLALGGATIGTDALGLTGSATISGFLAIGGSGLYVGSVANPYVALNGAANGDVGSISTGRVGFAASTSAKAALDTYFTRGGASFMVANGTLGTAGYAVASLPAAPGTGARAYVTDQLTTCPVLGGTFTGGGAVVCSAFYTGAAWTHQ